MTYAAQPGTIAHRAIEYLRAQPDGTALPSAVLAEVLAIEAADVAVYLQTPRRFGALVASRIMGRGNALQWSLGDGVPLAVAADDEERRKPTPAPDPALRSVFDFAQAGVSPFEKAYADALVSGLGMVKMEHVPAAELVPDVAATCAAQPAGRHPADVASDPEGMLITRPGEPLRSAPWPKQAAEPPPAHIDHPPEDELPRIALWDDGALTIVRGDERIEFAPAAARHIFQYLTRVLVGGEA